MSFKNYLFENGFFNNRDDYRHILREYLYESKNNPKKDLLIPDDMKIVKDYCREEETIIAVTKLLLSHFYKYIETLNNSNEIDCNTLNELKKIFDIEESFKNKSFLKKLNINIKNPKQICELLNFISYKLELLIKNYKDYHEYFAGCDFIKGDKVFNQSELPNINDATNKYYVAFVYKISSSEIENFISDLDSNPIEDQIYLKFDFRTICQIQKNSYINKRIPVTKLDRSNQDSQDCIRVSEIQKNSQVYTISIHDSF